jgi:RsiW-degrading membrane proteinase PrsW (M82 family)
MDFAYRSTFRRMPQITAFRFYDENILKHAPIVHVHRSVLMGRVIGCFLFLFIGWICCSCLLVGFAASDFWLQLFGVGCFGPLV